MNGIDYDLLEISLPELRKMYKKYKLEFETPHPSTMRRPAIIRAIQTYRELIKIRNNLPLVPETTQLAPRSIPTKETQIEELKLIVPSVPPPRIKSN